MNGIPVSYPSETACSKPCHPEIPSSAHRSSLLPPSVPPYEGGMQGSLSSLLPGGEGAGWHCWLVQQCTHGGPRPRPNQSLLFWHGFRTGVTWPIIALRSLAPSILCPCKLGVLVPWRFARRELSVPPCLRVSVFGEKCRFSRSRQQLRIRVEPPRCGPQSSKLKTTHSCSSPRPESIYQNVFASTDRNADEDAVEESTASRRLVPAQQIATPTQTGT